MAALSAAQRKANDKYIKENYSQVKLSMPNAEAKALDAYCKSRGLTKAGFIRTAIKEKMERDNAVTDDLEIKKQLSEEHGISVEEIDSAIDFGRAIDVMEARIPGTKDVILSGELKEYLQAKRDECRH